MKHSQYHIEASLSFLKFKFYSQGSKGKVKKQIVFKPIKDSPNVFNLGFGDVDKNGNINDIVVTGNNDSQRVLATVGLAVYKFFERHPDCYVFATGSTQSCTRLYRIAISNNMEEIQNEFHLYGFIDNSWQVFQKEKDYKAFLIKRKNE